MEAAALPLQVPVPESYVDPGGKLASGRRMYSKRGHVHNVISVLSNFYYIGPKAWAGELSLPTRAPMANDAFCELEED